MPSWKKIVISGSDASLNSLTVTNGVTGSLFGTASYAITASYAQTAQTLLGSVTSALTASYVNPLRQTVIVTGSVLLNQTVGAASAIENPNDGIGLVLRGKGNNQTADLRIVANGGGWTDSINTAYFQVTSSAGNYLTFMGGTYGADAPFERFQLNSKYTTFTNYGYTLTPVPTHVFEIINSTAATPVLGLRGAASQAANYLDVTASGSAAGNVFTITKDGNIGIGISAPSYKFDVTGDGRFTSNLTVTGSTISIGGFTGSLFGTSSWAVNSLSASYYGGAVTSASYASTASYVSGLNLSQITTGSVTASVSTGVGSFSVISGSTNLLYVSSSGNAGIGTTLTVDNVNQAVNIFSQGTVASRGLSVYQNNNGAQAATMVFYKSRGTNASPSAATTNDLVGAFIFRPYVGSAYTTDRSLFGASMATSTGIGLYFIAGSSDGNYNPSMYIHPTNNVIIGSSQSILTGITDSGFRLDVNGTTRLQSGLTVTGSTISTAGFTGSLFGTASWSQNSTSASYALTASYWNGTVVSSSYALTASYWNGTVNSASYALTASYSLRSGGGSGVTINNNTNDYILTATGTSDTINGESNLKFDGVSLVQNPSQLGTASPKGGFTSWLDGNKFTDYISTNFSGEVVSGVLGSDLGAETLVYLTSTNVWQAAIADTTGQSGTNLLGITLTSGIATQSIPILLHGYVRMGSGSYNQIGEPMYMSDTTAGRIDFNAPTTTNHIIRIVGYCLAATEKVLRFHPDNSWTVIP